MSVTGEAGLRWPYYDRSGKRISVLKWGALHEDWDYRLIREDLAGEHRVMTVWLGIDESFGCGPEPLIFATAILPPHGGIVSEVLCSREQDALARHDIVLLQAREWFGPRMLMAPK